MHTTSGHFRFLLRATSQQARSLVRNKLLPTMEGSLSVIWSQMKEAAIKFAQVCMHELFLLKFCNLTQ